MIKILKNQYRGKGYVLGYNAYQEFINLKISDFENPTQFIIKFKALISQMNELNVSLTDLHYHMHFIDLLTNSYPIWADRQRHAARNATEGKTCSLDDLIQDVTYESRRTEGVTSSGTAFFGNKQQVIAKNGLNNNNSKTKLDKRKDKDGKCKYCECPHKFMHKLKHSDAECLLNPRNVNKKKQWED